MPGRLKDKVALVIGAGSVGEGWGNGNATAVAYAREGARVVCVDIDVNAARATADIIRGEGGEALEVAANVTREDDIQGAVERAMGAWGQIDILHNNVGLVLAGGLIESTLEILSRSMDVNVFGAYRTCKAVIPIMLRQRSGAIVNISSMAAVRVGTYGYVAYNTSKAALNHFTRAVAIEFADKGIRANAIMPGAMDTPHVQKQIIGFYKDAEAMKADRDAASPMKHQGTGWDVAWASVFLASDEAKYITGVTLPVDGGIHCVSR